VALSDHEKRILEELESDLSDVGSKFTNKVAAPRSLMSTRIIAGSLVAFAGISILILAAFSHVVFIGVLGFIAMLAGLVVATSGRTSQNSGSVQPKPRQAKPKKPSSGTFFDDQLRG